MLPPGGSVIYKDIAIWNIQRTVQSMQDWL